LIRALHNHPDASPPGGAWLLAAASAWDVFNHDRRGCDRNVSPRRVDAAYEATLGAAGSPSADGGRVLVAVKSSVPRDVREQTVATLIRSASVEHHDSWPTLGDRAASKWALMFGYFAALHQSRLKRGTWPDCFDELWQQIAAKVRASEAARQMVDVLMLVRDHGPEHVELAVRGALTAGSHDGRAVAVLARRAQRPRWRRWRGAWQSAIAHSLGPDGLHLTVSAGCAHHTVKIRRGRTRVREGDGRCRSRSSRGAPVVVGSERDDRERGVPKDPLGVAERVCRAVCVGVRPACLSCGQPREPPDWSRRCR
jgi:hypothetical protein